MTIGERYNVTDFDIKRSWNNTQVKEYYRQSVMYGKANFELENNVEKAVFYYRYLKGKNNEN